jgi:hypothetical protein
MTLLTGFETTVLMGFGMTLLAGGWNDAFYGRSE